jgi:hypothetical protein
MINYNMGNQESTQSTTPLQKWEDQHSDPEIEAIRNLMREKGVAILTMYQGPFNPDDFIVTNVVPDLPNDGTTLDKLSEWKLPPGTKFKIVKESIGDIFNRATVATYLQKTFPLKTFTVQEVELAYYIMSIIIKKANSYENIDDIKHDFYYDDSGRQKGKNSYIAEKKPNNRAKVNFMLNTQVMSIVCYGIHRQDDPDFDSETCPDITLFELLINKQKLRVFFDFWRTVPDYESVYRILHQHKKCPPDISNYIITLASKLYG